MSLDFDGVNDVVAVGSVTLGTQITYFAWFSANNQGESNAGTLVGHGDTAVDERTAVFWNTSAASKKLRLSVGTDATNGAVDMTTGFTNVTGWKAVAVTFDLTGPSMVLYHLEDGVLSGPLTNGAGLTSVTSATGNLRADGLSLRVGNTSSGARTWDGLIGEVAAWSRRLSEDEIRSVFVLGPLAQPSSLYLYLPMDNTGAAQATDVSGNGRNGTITEAVAGENPPARPAGRRG